MTNLGFGGLQDTPGRIFWGPSTGSGGVFPRKILKMESLRLAENVFPAFIVTAIK